MENVFGIFKPTGRYKDTIQSPDLSSKLSTLVPALSAKRGHLLPKESHNQGYSPFLLNTQDEEHNTSLVQKIAARFVPKLDIHTSQDQDVADGRATPLSRGGNPVNQRQLFKAKVDDMDTKSPLEGFINKVTVEQLMSFKEATKQTSEQTSVKKQDWLPAKKGEWQGKMWEEFMEKEEESKTKGVESMKKLEEFARKGVESGKRDQHMLGLLVLVWLINQREILKDLVELRNKSINGQKILHSNQDLAATSLMHIGQQISSLQSSLQKQQQQVHTQMTHLKRLVLLFSLVQLTLLASMVTWSHPGMRDRVYNWYQYLKVSVPRPAVSVLATCRDVSQLFLQRFTSKFHQMTYGWSS